MLIDNTQTKKHPFKTKLFKNIDKLKSSSLRKLFLEVL